MTQKNSMATAAVILGVLALLSSSALIVALPLGALSILCALLSRTEKRMPLRSITAVTVSILAVIYGSYTTVQSFHHLKNDPQALSFYMEYLEDLCDEYGLSETYDELFGDWNKNDSDPLPPQTAPYEAFPGGEFA